MRVEEGKASGLRWVVQVVEAGWGKKVWADIVNFRHSDGPPCLFFNNCASMDVSVWVL